MSEQELNMIFGRNLLKLLERRGLSQVDLANYLGISEAAVSLWISGKNSPRMSKVDKICELLKCSRSALLAEDGIKLVEQEDVTQMLQDLYDKNRLLMETMSDATPEELQEIQKYVEFVKSKR